jgi:hypothetical protein
MEYPYCKVETMWSSGAEPVTGPGDEDLDKKGLRDADLKSLSLAPSSRIGNAGDGGLFAVDEELLSESDWALRMYSVAPSV